MQTTNGNLYAASAQWRDRPDDERFWDLSSLHAACVKHREQSKRATIAFGDMSIVTGAIGSAHAGDVRLIGKAGTSAALTHYAFGQLCNAVQAPAKFLRSLSSDLTARALNESIVNAAKAGATPRELLFRQNGDLSVRAMLSGSYGRIWDADVAAGACELGRVGWRPPCGLALGRSANARPATKDDILEGQINVREGDSIIPSGLYASDHDLFVFLVAPDRVIRGVNDHPLMRGVMLRNSEVGDSALVATFFLMQAVCGNHIIWNASGVHEIRVIHRKNASELDGRRAFSKFGAKLRAELRVYENASAANEERAIRTAQARELGSTKEEVIAVIVKYAKGHSLEKLTESRVTQAYAIADEHSNWYGSPRSVWGMVSGLTQLSQRTGHTDARHEIDACAGELMSVAF
jgi:hypothetical protein